jgi:hypothetical protein
MQQSNASTSNHATLHTYSQDTTVMHPSGKLVNYKWLVCYELGLLDTPSYMWSIVDQNVHMWHMTVYCCVGILHFIFLSLALILFLIGLIVKKEYECEVCNPSLLLHFFMAHQSLVGQVVIIIKASWSHWDTPHLLGLLCKSDQPNARTSTWQHTLLKRDIHAPSGIWTHIPRKQAAVDPHLRPGSRWITQNWYFLISQHTPYCILVCILNGLMTCSQFCSLRPSKSVEP